MKKKRTAAMAVLTTALTFGIAFTGMAAGGKWLQGEHGWRYKSSDGTHPTSTWIDNNGTWYHLDESGYMETGWLEIDDKWYYLDLSSGVMVSDTIREIDGVKYHFDKTGVCENKE